jgi:hypothetical protein
MEDVDDTDFITYCKMKPQNFIGKCFFVVLIDAVMKDTVEI